MFLLKLIIKRITDMILLAFCVVFNTGLGNYVIDYFDFIFKLL